MATKIRKQTRTTWQQACERFAKALIDGTAEFSEAYVAHIEAGFAREDLHAGAPMLTGGTWQRLERAGRGELPPELVWYNGPTRVLRIAPRDYDRLKAAGGVDIVTPDGEDVRRVPLDDLKPYQASIAIDHDGSVRSKTAQKREIARLRDMQTAADKRRQERHSEQMQKAGWILHEDGSATVNGVVFSRHQLRRFFTDWQDVVLR